MNNHWLHVATNSIMAAICILVWNAGGNSFLLMLAGINMTVAAMLVLMWYWDRKLSREIIHEIEVLSKNWDNQMSLFAPEIKIYDWDNENEPATAKQSKGTS